MFDSPQPAEGAEGGSDKNPIVIPDVTRSEFVALMDYLYEGSFFKNKLGRKTSCEEYTNLLSIATRFVCIEARQKAIEGIESHGLDPIQKLVLADIYDIPQWLMPSYIELCKRDTPLTPDEVVRIGPEKAMSIAKARETIRGSPDTRRMIRESYSWTTWPCGVFEDSRVERIINEALLWNIRPDPSPALPREVNIVTLESVSAVRKWGGRKKKGYRSFFKIKPEHRTSREDYIDLLSIAIRFVCIEVQQKAILGIESYSLDPIKRLVLADTYDIPQWLMPSYVELCKRDDPPTPDEALWIGAEKVMSIAKAREIIRSSPETRQMSGWGRGTTWPSAVFQNSRVERIMSEPLLWDVRLDPNSSPVVPCQAKVDLDLR
ncbi:hypothetical protein PQX77_017128, partial [Marasmius sp. AFHP31]